MRTIELAGLAALALAAVACGDERDAPRAAPTAPLADPPHAAESRTSTGSRITVRGVGAVSARLPHGIAVHGIQPWTAAGIFRAGVALDNTAGSPFGVLAVTDPRRKFIPVEGARVVRRMLEADGTRISVMFDLGADGGPIRGTRLYVNGQVQMTAEFQWAAAQGAWTLQSSVRRLYRGGQLVSEVRGSAGGVELAASRAIVPDVLAHFAFGVARLLAPVDAHAQLLSGPCRQEMLEYTAAEAALAAAIINAEKNPANAAAWLLVAAASAKATQAEMKLWLCQQNDWERSHPISGGGIGGSGIGGDGGGLYPLGACDPDMWLSTCGDPPSKF